jgi:hypothetical protein
MAISAIFSIANELLSMCRLCVIARGKYFSKNLITRIARNLE